MHGNQQEQDTSPELECHLEALDLLPSHNQAPLLCKTWQDLEKEEIKYALCSTQINVNDIKDILKVTSLAFMIIKLQNKHY